MRALILAAALFGAANLRAALPLPGSDTYGYSAAVQAYSWTEISGSGTAVTNWAGGADDGSALINIPFNFRFYGAPYNKVSVSSNGYLQFGSQSSFYGVNCLGANLDPRNVAALYWMDLNPGAGGVVYTQVQGSPGSYVFIVQFQAVPPSVGGGAVTAQWRLYEADNSLEAAWASTASTGSGADAVAGLRSGFDCANRTSFPLSCQQALLTDGLSVRFNYPVVEPACGTPTVTQSFTQSATFSVSPTFSPSPSITPTFSATPSWTDTPSVTPSFSPSPSLSESPTLVETATASPSATVSPSPSASRTPQVLSDAFGYVALQAPLAWDEISGTGTPITTWAGGPDDGSALVDLPVGWLFRFYGADYTKVAVSSNGYLQFGSASAVFGNSCLNAGASPFGLAALFWSDLDLDLGGTVYWQVLGSAPNRRLVIQFQAVPNQGATGTLTAQAALFEGSHALSLRYLSTASLGDGIAAAAGLRSFYECPNRTGLSLSCNQAQLPTGTQWDLSYPLIEPACGTPTFTATPTSSATGTPSASPSSSDTPSVSPSHSPTESPSATLSPTPSHSPTQTQTWSITPTHSVSPTITQTGTISPTHTDSPTVTDTPSITQTGTISPTFSESPTATPSPTESPSFTESPTATETPSITETLSNTATFSESPTASESWTVSATPSDSPTQSPSFTATPSFSFSPTRSATPTATPTGTPTGTATATPSATRTGTRTASSTRTVSPTPTSTLFPPATKPGCLVLGQTSYLSAVSGSASMNLPAGVALDTRGTPFKVYVADSSNHRILFWNDAAALSNGLPPEGVIGQADFMGSSANRGLSPAADGLNAPTGLAVDPFNGDLWVADSGNHRVLRFSAPIALSGAAASRVLGQGGSFSSAVASLGGVSASSLNTPSGLSMDSFGRLAVADTLHHRVLRFSDPGNNSAADAAWGQALSLTQGLPNQGGSANAGSLLSPQGVHLGINEVWVADSGNHRVLRFATAPFLTGTADRVLGQPDYSASSPNQGFGSTNETRLDTPRGLSWDGGGRLIVSDSGNHRLVAFEPPFDNFADQYYGQSNIGGRNPGTGQDQLQGPSAAFAWGGLLAVADTSNHRVLFYGCGAGVGVATPTPTRSATPTHSPTATATPTVTPTSSVTPSFSPSPSFTASETRTPSATVSVSFTRSSTPSITQTRTVTPTETPVATATVTQTVPPTLTPYPRSDGRILAWPNPAPRDGGRACIGFVPAADVRIEIYDRLAQPVVSLSGAQVDAAGGFACWDLRNREGTLLAPGWYYVRVLSDGQAKLGKLTVR